MKTKTQKKPKPRLKPELRRIKDAYFWFRQDMTDDDDKPPYYGLKRTAISPYVSTPHTLTTEDPAS